ncbi:hypothetical protein [Terrabacter sp. Soil811]|uniref:hypothetical protein n=1 Tax=Terrabacter sp. Soil811 TaxID=1736419 RepID=UPI00138F6244|nr:hypothetical protein [Terrabacter sp. Soil811]
MTPGDVLVPAAITILFVVAWFVFGIVDSTRDDPSTRPADPTSRETSEQRLPERR